MEKNGKFFSISMIEPIGGHGGNEFYDFGLCEAISKQGMGVTLYTCDETTLDEKYHCIIRVKKCYKKIYGKDPRLIRGLRYFRGTIQALLDAKFQKSQIAHFHLYGFSNLEYFNIFLFKKAGFKIVATVHDIENLSGLNEAKPLHVYKRFDRVVDRFIVHTKYTLQELKKFVSKKIDLVPPSDIDFVYKKTIEQKEARKYLDLNIPENSILILFFGQIKEVKGLDILLKAFSQVEKKMPNIYLLIAGKTWKTTFDKYENIIRSFQIDKRKIIKHIRYIKNEEVPLYFKASDMIILPYKKIYNSGVLIRAMDYGTPIIASDLEAIKEVIDDGYNGLLFSSGNVNDLAEKILKLARDESLMTKLKLNALKTIDLNYSLEAIGSKMRSIYLSLLE